jgi:hypothetical protein
MEKREWPEIFWSGNKWDKTVSNYMTQ